MTLRRAGRTLRVYALILLIMLASGILMLEGAALLPQARITDNFITSLEQFDDEGYSPFILNRWRTDGRLNNRSELRILQYSVYMDATRYPDAIFSNPAYVAEVSSAGPAEVREPTLSEAPANSRYVHYWQGFRAVVRPLLALCDYGDMRRVLMWTYCLLAALCASELARRTRGRAATVAFALSLALFNPVVVSTSFQYGCCYIIAMLGMLAVSLLHGRARPARVLFAVAVATQYFDFYTTPSLTLVYPLLMALVCEAFEPRAEGVAPWRSALRCAVAWLAGYASMWLLKLLLTTLFTQYNALAEGFNSFVGWVAGSKVAEKATLGQAFGAAFSALGTLALIITGAYAALTALVMLRKKPDREALSRAALCAGAGLVPLIWIAVAAQPTAAHAYFQYRTLGGLVFALTLAPALLARPKVDIARRL